MNKPANIAARLLEDEDFDHKEYVLANLNDYRTVLEPSAERNGGIDYWVRRVSDDAVVGKLVWYAEWGRWKAIVKNTDANGNPTDGWKPRTRTFVTKEQAQRYVALKSQKP